MQMSKISKVLAALVLTLAAGASANGFEQQVEGVTAAGLFSPVKVAPSMSWKEIGRKAFPDFPTISLPDGVAYRVDSLCSDGTHLRNVYAKKAYVCYDQGEGACVRGETVELKTPINYTYNVCTAWREEKITDGTPEDPRPWIAHFCVKSEQRSATHALAYNVEVRTAPRKMLDPETVDINSGEVLFSKPFAIPSCK
jgi:hypothetical protein